MTTAQREWRITMDRLTREYRCAGCYGTARIPLGEVADSECR